MKILIIIMTLLLSIPSAFAQSERGVLDIMLTNYEYPYPVSFHTFESQNQDLKMAYMDVRPSVPNGKVILLFHGKNFNGAYWKTTIEALTSNGYRVIAPDQIGFGKSSKPAGYQFTFQQLAVNTKNLLAELQVEKISLLGHSMGGMLAARFALMYRESVEKLVLENPIGLEDWKLVTPYTTIDDFYRSELNVSFENTKQYQLTSYYDAKWKPEYDEWVYLVTGWAKHPDYPIVAMNNAQTFDMIFTQPVVYEFEQIQVPTLLLIGTRDRTAIGKNNVKDESIRKKMGQYQILGKTTQKKIPGAQLVELHNVGHLPHIEAFEKFISPLINFLKQ